MTSLIKQFRDKTSVNQKVGLVLVLLLVVAGVNVGIVYAYQSQVETLGNSVNVAGEQRMLTQRMARFSNRIATGEASSDTREKLTATVQRYDSNLAALETGGTRKNSQLRPAPEATMDELTAEKDAWQTYRSNIQTIIETDPRNPEYEAAVEYVAANNDQLLVESDAVVTAYVELDGDGKWAEEINIAGRQRMLSQRISETVQFIDRNEVPNETHPEVQAAKENLSAYVSEYEHALNALDNGGKHRGTQLQEAPPSVQDDIDTVRETWTPLRERASIVATEAKFNPKFVTALEHVRGSSDQLLTTSDELVTAFATLSADRIGFMKAVLLWLFLLDLVVFAFGLVLVRRYVGQPIADIANVASAIADGKLDVEIDEKTPDSTDDDSSDEVVMLGAAFDDMHDYLTTIAAQSNALANQDFDAAVLEEDVSGEFGQTVKHDLQTLIEEMKETNEEAQTARAEAEALAESLDRKANQFSDTMALAASGDLTARMDTYSESEAMTEIAHGFNDMMDEIEGTLLGIQRFTQDVATASQQVMASAEEIQDASVQVSDSIQEVSAGAAQQDERLQNVSSEMTTLSATIEEITSSADEVASVADKAADRGDAGREYAQDAIREMDEIELKTDETVQEVEQLDDEMKEIGEIVEMITEIAEQTNILALNASIEAARAGEAGDGFAVVADEIKTLASEASQATQEIEALITDIQSSTDEVVTDMRETSERVSTGMETIEQALDALDDIVDHVESANGGIQEINGATDSQARTTEDVVGMVEDVVSVSQQTTTEAEHVSEAAEEQASSLSDITGSIEDLSGRADELQDLLEQFDVGDNTNMPAATNTATVAPDGGLSDGDEEAS